MHHEFVIIWRPRFCRSVGTHGKLKRSFGVDRWPKHRTDTGVIFITKLVWKRLQGYYGMRKNLVVLYAKQVCRTVQPIRGSRQRSPSAVGPGMSLRGPLPLSIFSWFTGTVCCWSALVISRCLLGSFWPTQVLPVQSGRWDPFYMFLLPAEFLLSSRA